MQRPADYEEDVVQKRQRNRVAQQKYRKRLKAHIEDLEKRAAVADKLVKNHKDSLPGELVSMFGPPTNVQEREAADSTSPTPTPADTLQTTETSTETSTSAASLIKTPQSALQSRPMVAGDDSDLATDDDFLKGLFFSAHDLSGNKDSFVADMNIMDLQQNGSDPFDTGHSPLAPSSKGHDANPLPLPPARDRSSLNSLAPESARDRPAGLEKASIETRVDYVLKSMENAGFSSPDAFMSSLYTGAFKDRSVARTAQVTARSRGLPSLLDDLRAGIDEWPIWQSRAYADSIMRSASSAIMDELDRLARKTYKCEEELQRDFCLAESRSRSSAASDAVSGSSTHRSHVAATELRKTLRNELPNLDTLITSLSSDGPQASHCSRVQLLSTTIKLLTAGSDELLQEVTIWLHQRRISDSAND